MAELSDALRSLLGLLTLAFALCMLGTGLGAFAFVGHTLWAELVERVESRISASWWPDMRLGALHGLGLFVLAITSKHHPLLGLACLIWLGLALGLIWVGLPALIMRTGRLAGGSPGGSAWKGGLGLCWACAVPFLGQALLVMLLLGLYGTSLGCLLQSRRHRQARATAPLAMIKSPEIQPSIS